MVDYCYYERCWFWQNNLQPYILSGLYNFADNRLDTLQRLLRYRSERFDVPDDLHSSAGFYFRYYQSLIVDNSLKIVLKTLCLSASMG